MSNHIDKIFYINLDKREDRKLEIEAELSGFDLLDNAERIPGIFTPGQGILGCTMSHLHAIKLAKERGYSNVLILEDDFQFTLSKAEFEDQMRLFFDSDLGLGLSFDVCMISYNIQRSEPSSYPFLTRVLEAQTASGYIVSACFYYKLIELYEWAIPLLSQTKEHWHYANDQCWTHLQDRDKWYCIQPRLGIQSAGFSDNSSRFIDRGV